MDSWLNKSCTSNLGYQDYQKRHKQTGCTNNSAEAYFFNFFFFTLFFNTTNPRKVSSALNVLTNPPQRLSTGTSSPGRHLGLQDSSRLLQKQMHLVTVRVTSAGTGHFLNLKLNVSVLRLWSVFTVFKCHMPVSSLEMEPTKPAERDLKPFNN